MQNGDKINDIYTRTRINSAKLDAVADDVHEVKANHTGLVSFAKSTRLIAVAALLGFIAGVVFYAALVYGGVILPRDIGLSFLGTAIGGAMGILIRRSV